MQFSNNNQTKERNVTENMEIFNKTLYTVKHLESRNLGISK